MSKLPGFDYDFGSILIKNGFASGKIESFEFGDQILDFNQLLHGSTVYDTNHLYDFEQGRVVIHDTGGADTLTFGEGIVSTDIIAQTEAGNNNFLIGIKEEGVAFADLTHIITIQGGLSTATAIESYVFADGTTLDFNGLLQLQNGTVGDDYLRFSNANDTVDGLTGNDTIITGAGDDQLTGGQGDDTLFGGLGDDRYVFNRGDGRDLIVDHVDAGQGFAGNDSLIFGEGVNPDELIGLRQGNDIVLAIKEEGVAFSGLHDQITLSSWYESSERVENVVFADGTVWGTSEILSSTLETGALYGLDGDDIIIGNEEDNVIFARAGDDTVSGLGGNDSLYGEGGNDILTGNGGNDQLEGGQGDDIYRFNRGDGHDIIIDGLLGDFNDNGIDAVVFGSGISSADLIVQRQGTDMVVALRQDGVAFTDLVDSMILRNWYEAKNRIEYFQFADASQLTAGELLQFIQAGDGEEIVGLETGSVFGNGTAGNSYLGKAANDVYHFATGNGRDTLTDSGGYDRIIIGEGTAPAGFCITWLQGSDDIVLSFAGNEDDELILKGWYSDQGRIEAIEFGDGTVWDGSAIIDALGTDAEDVFIGLKGTNNTIYARGGDDIVSTFDGDDILHGGDGADGLDAQQGDDTLLGDAGDDQLWGGAGDDVYIFNRGDGQDLIFDDDKFVADAGNDTVRFGVGITKADLIFKVNRENNDLYIGIIDPASPDTPFDELSDTITISNWYLAKNRIENIELTGTGEVLDVAAVMAAMGTDSDDVIKALSEGSVLDGQLGNDILYGNVGNDILAGSGGDDILEGGAGDDRLAGGVGNDQLKGEGGADTYQFGRGDGSDTVYDSVTTSYYQYGWVTNEVTGYQRWGKVLLYRSVDGGDDIVQFGDGIVSDDLLVRTTGNDITIAIKEDGKVFDELSDKLTIIDFYNTENKIEHFTFSDGQVLIPQEILNLMFTEGDDDVTFETDADQIIFAKGGDDSVIGGNGDDQITGGSGNDFLNGAKGDDTYLFGKGDGQDIVEDNGQLAWWQLGNGQDTIHIQGGLTPDDVVIAWGGTLSAENKNDLVIAIKEDGVELTGLSDRIVIRDWFNRQTKVEQLTFDNGDKLDEQAIFDAVFSDNNDEIDISGSFDGHVFNGLAGADTITATQGDDVINGGADHDILIGETGRDILTGGTGNDQLYGGSGHDSYKFNRGDGSDVIYDNVRYQVEVDHIDRFGHHHEHYDEVKINADDDSIVFGEGTTVDDVVFYWNYETDENGDAINRDKSIGSNDLIVALKNPDNPTASLDELTDKITLKDWFYRPALPEINIFADNNYSGEGGDYEGSISCEIPHSEYVNQIETFAFSDGTSLTRHDLLMALSSDRDDRIEGVIGESSVLVGLAGNDVLIGHDVSDELYGGVGDDRLEGGYGENLLDGGVGDDTYVLTANNTGPWDERTSEDTLIDTDGIDKVLFLNDIAREDIVFTLDGPDLVVSYGLELQHQLRIIDNGVERFETSDGSYISRDGIMGSLAEITAQMGSTVNEASDIHQNIDLKSLQYNAWHDQFVEHHGHSDWNEFTGNSENEIVFGGSGQDELLGHSGNDTLIAGAGDDYLNAGNGNDTYVFKRQDQNDTILDAENQLLLSGYDDYGDDEVYYSVARVVVDEGDFAGDKCEWNIQANVAPSNDTLILKNDIAFSDLHAYWATDEYDWRNSNVNDLLLRVDVNDGSNSWNDRATNVTTIVDYYATRTLQEYGYNPDTDKWGYMDRVLVAADLAEFSDKALKQLAYQVEDGNNYVRRTRYFSNVTRFLRDESEAAVYNREYRSEEDTITLSQFYDQSYTIENIVIEGEDRTLTNNDIMELMSSTQAEMIRGVDWADNTISALAGNDAVVGGEMNDAITAGTGDDLIHGQLGDDSYHFGRGDGRDVLLDGPVPFQDIAQQARYWRGRRDWYGGGEMEYRAVVASDDDNGSPTSDPDSQPSIALGPDDGGYDRVVFDSDLYVQDVSFVDYNGGDGLYVGYGNLVASTEDNNDSTSYSRGNATDFSFTIGDSPIEKHQLVYADDIVLPEQYQLGHAIEEFVLNDGSRIRNADIYTGLQESRDYIDLNRSFLEQIQQDGRDAKGYVDQIMLTKWQRQNQNIAGSETDELLFLGDGDDTVDAAGGDDTIGGGFGTDTLLGGSGDDTYSYNRWDGADTIIDATGYDRLVLGNDLLLTDLVAKIDVDSGDLTLGIINDVDRLRADESGTDYTPDPASLEQKIVVTDFHSLNGRLELFSFSDGTSMSAMELYNHFFTSEQDDLILGLEGDNVIVAKGGDDRILLGDGNHDIDAGTGDDTVTTGGGDDVINTGGGADIVHAGAGNDTIISSGDGNQLSGAEGDDRLNGGNGDDQFIFGLGDGNDTIYDQGGLDTLVIDDIQGDITPDNLWVERIGNDVVVELEDGSSTFIKDWGLVANRVENIRFGTVNSAIDDLLFLRARNYDLSLNEDTAISGVIELGNAGDGVVFNVEQGGDNGSFTVELDGSWSYAPNQDANGLEQVVVKVTNDQGEVAFSTLNLLVDPVNDLPIVESSDTLVLQDVRELAGQVIASDVDGDLLSYAVCSDPAYGALTLNADGSWNYQAAAGFIGDDQATISVDDGHGGLVTTTLNFEVLVSAPSVSNYELSLDEDGSLISQLDVTNPVGGTLTYIVDNNSNHGNFTIAADGRFSYTPTADYHGGDEVQLTVTNDYGLSATSTISLNILPINDLPETVAEESRVLQDIRVVTGTIEASDIDGDILSYAVSGAAEHGSFSIDQEGNWSYEAAELFIGSDQVVVTIEDGNGGRVTSTLDFSVLVSSPEVNNVDDVLEEDGSANGMLAVTNPIGGSLVYSVANSGEYGSFDLDDQGNWQYRPDENYHGSDLITVIVTNEYGLTATATIDLAIISVNDAPTVAESTPYQVLGIASVTGQVDANDVDGDLLSYQITSNSEHGTFVIDETGTWSYTPVSGFVGTDSVSFAIHDGKGGQVSSSLSFIGNIYTDGDLVIDGSGPDVLKLDGISKDDLQLNRNAEDLSVVVRDRGTITLVGYYSTPENGVEYLETIEGPLHLAKDLIINVEPSWCSWLFGGSEEGMDGEKNLLYGTDSGETIYGANINDVIFGDSGNDRLYGNNGDDTLVGGSGCDTLRGGLGDDTLYGDSHADNLLGNSGNDALVGGDGNDCLQGGTGNDWLWGDDGCDTLYGEEGADSISGSLGDDLLYGGGGNDLYLFNRNDGYDHLYDNLYSGFMNFCHEDAGQDTVRFGADIGKEDVAVYMSCGNLYLSYGDNDVVKINDQSSDKDKIERFELADGSYLTDSDINQLIQEISSFAVNEGICINSVNDVRQNDALMTLVVESWHQ